MQTIEKDGIIEAVPAPITRTWRLAACPGFDVAGRRIRANTLAEARAILKAHLGVERLPVGTSFSSDGIGEACLPDPKPHPSSSEEKGGGDGA